MHQIQRKGCGGRTCKTVAAEPTTKDVDQPCLTTWKKSSRHNSNPDNNWIWSWKCFAEDFPSVTCRNPPFPLHLKPLSKEESFPPRLCMNQLKEMSSTRTKKHETVTTSLIRITFWGSVHLTPWIESVQLIPWTELVQLTPWIDTARFSEVNWFTPHNYSFKCGNSTIWRSNSVCLGQNVW